MKFLQLFLLWVRNTYASLLYFLANALKKHADKFKPVLMPLTPGLAEKIMKPAVEAVPIKPLKEQLEEHFLSENNVAKLSKIYSDYVKEKQGNYDGQHPWFALQRDIRTRSSKLLQSGDQVGVLKHAETTSKLHEKDIVANFGEMDEHAGAKMHQAMKKRLGDIDAALKNNENPPGSVLAPAFKRSPQYAITKPNKVVPIKSKTKVKTKVKTKTKTKKAARKSSRGKKK